MKRFIPFTILFISSSVLRAQNNVGVNTTNPQASLDVRGTQRVGGINNYIRYDSATGRIEWVGAALYAPVSQQIIRHSASTEGLYAGGGKLEYRNTTGPVFYSDWTNGNGYIKNNLGINNSSPQFPLSFSDDVGDKISFYGTPTSNYGIGLQAGVLQIHSEGPGADILFGTGSSGSFSEVMRVKGNGNVGIGNAAPHAPLTFASTFGPKISLYGNSTNSYGFDISNSTLRMFTDGPFSEMLFGYLSGGVFTQRMRIKANGNVAIGSNNPDFLLDVNGRMRIRSGGTNASSAGIWLNNNNNAEEVAFMGMQRDDQIGFSGGLNANFVLDITTGAWIINHNFGLPGKVPQSTGSGGPTIWASPTNAMYNSTVSVTNNSPFTLAQSTGRAQIPGMTYTFNLDNNAKVFVSYNITAQSVGCGLCGSTQAWTEVYVDGTLSGSIKSDIGNGQSTNMNYSRVYDLLSGSHTISVGAMTVGTDITYGPCCSFEKVMSIQIISK